jgi:hypothetical protein
LIELALKSLTNRSLSRTKLTQHLLQTLATYKGEKVCYGPLCATPQKDPPNVKAAAQEQT